MNPVSNCRVFLTIPTNVNRVKPNQDQRRSSKILKYICKPNGDGILGHFRRLPLTEKKKKKTVTSVNFPRFVCLSEILKRTKSVADVDGRKTRFPVGKSVTGEERGKPPPRGFVWIAVQVSISGRRTQIRVAFTPPGDFANNKTKGEIKSP